MKRNSIYQIQVAQIWAPSVLLLLVALSAGCVNHQANQPSKSAAALSPPESLSERPKWLVPTGWVAVEPSGVLQVAAFAIPDVSGDTHMTVLKLNNYPYALLANVNRWREQVGLPPVESSFLKDISRPAKTASGDIGTAFQIVGKEKSILAAAFTRGDTTWFFKLIAPNVMAQRQRDSFDYFIGSFHL